MAKAYDKEFLVNVYLSKFMTGLPNIDVNLLCELEDNANTFYDKVGKDKFREYSSVTPEAIRTYNANYLST